MGELDEDKMQSLREHIEPTEEASISELPFELFEKQENRTTKLVATSGSSSPIDGRRRWHDFKFRQPVLVTRVTVEVEGYNEYSDFEFRWTDESGQQKDARGRPVDGILSFDVNDICRKISFQPPSVFFSKTHILKVRVEGIERDAIPSALNNLSNFAAYRAQILQHVDTAIRNAKLRIQEAQKADAERAATQREIAQLKGQVARSKKGVDDLALKRNELIAQNAAVESSIDDAKTRLDNIQADAARLTKQNQTLKESIEASTERLQELRSNINLFPSEIVSFVDQGSRNIRQYFWLALAPIGIILVMFILLVNGAANLTTVITQGSNINIEALMLSRIPYVVISLGIITACYKIARVFISELIKINNQRLNLTKISIIAKDVSTSAEHDLHLNEEDTFRLRADLKMQLLKDHLKDYLSKDFKMEFPRRIILGLPSFGQSDDDKDLEGDESEKKA